MRSTGKPNGPQPWVRSARLRLQLRPSELEDIGEVARGWRVSPGLVAWVLVHEGLSRWRGRADQLGTLGLELGALVGVLERHGFTVTPPASGAANGPAQSTIIPAPVPTP